LAEFMKSKRSLGALWLGIRIALILAGFNEGWSYVPRSEESLSVGMVGVGLLLLAVAGLVGVLGALGMVSMFTAKGVIWHRLSWTRCPFTEGPQFFHAFSIPMVATGVSEAVVSWNAIGRIGRDAAANGGLGLGVWLGLKVAQGWLFRRRFPANEIGEDSVPSLRLRMHRVLPKRAVVGLVGFLLVAVGGAVLSIALPGLPHWFEVIVLIGGVALLFYGGRSLGAPPGADSGATGAK
jgi:hypothetical protein